VPTVSIIIPCYNAAPWVADAIRSCLRQTWADREIIVVDDGSKDDSLARARQFEPQGVKVLAQANGGAASARNAGFRASRGDWIQYLDADDLLAPGKIAAQLRLAADRPAGCVLTARWGRFTAAPESAEIPAANPLFADLSPAEFFHLFASRDCMMHPAAWLVPRTVATLAGPWDERLSLNDDGEYFARIVSRSRQVVHCADALSYYRSNLAGSLSGQRSRRHLESGFLAVELIAGHILAAAPEARRDAADLFQRFAYDYYPAAPDLIDRALARARALGGSNLRPLGGRTFSRLGRLFGWKVARRLQVLAGRFPR